MNSPIYIDNNVIVTFDVDDTLVMHDGAGDLYITDPYIDNYTMLVRKHNNHIKLLKDYKGRGFFVIVWSAAGAAWAKAVVDALEINEWVDLIISKPMKYVDDLPGNEILGSRIYLKESSDNAL